MCLQVQNNKTTHVNRKKTQLKVTKFNDILASFLIIVLTIFPTS